MSRARPIAWTAALRPSFLRASPLLALGALGCRSATQIEIAVTTDLPCTRANGGASLTSGALIEIEGAPPATTSRTCTDSKLGTVVLIPSDATDAKVAFKVVGGIDGQNAEDCKAPEYGPKCIVARRALRFEPHTPLAVPVVLRSSCAGVSCDATQTCVQGACVDATIDPAKCEGSGCGESELGGGAGSSDAGVDATTADATTDSASDSPADAPPNDAPSDAPSDAPIVPPGDGSVLGCDLRGLQAGAPWPMRGYCPSNRAKTPYAAATPQSLPKWRYPATGYLPGTISAAPIVGADGTIYVATTGGVVDAITPAGAQRWHRADDAGPAPSGYDGYEGVPALASDGTLRLFNCGTYEYVALDGANGALRSRVAMGGGAACMRGPTSIGPDGVLYASDQSGDLYAVRADGGVKWVVPNVSYDYVMPAITPSGVITTQNTDNVFFGLADDAGLLWTIDSGLQQVDTFEIATDGKTARTFTQDGVLYSFGYDVDGGRRAWQQTVEPGFTIVGVALDDDGTAYVGADDGIHGYGADGGPGFRYVSRCGRPLIDGAGYLVAWCDGAIVSLDPHGPATPRWSVAIPHDLDDGGDVDPQLSDTASIGADGTVYIAVTYDAPPAPVSVVFAFGP